MNKYLIKNRNNLIIFFILAIVTYVTMIQVYNMNGLITEVVETNNYDNVPRVIITCTLVLAALSIISIFVAKMNRFLLNNISENLRKDIFDKIYSLDYVTFSRKDSAYYISMITNDVQMLEENYFSKIFDLMSDVVCLVVSLVSFAIIGWEYLVIVICLLVFTVIQPFVLKKKLASDGAKVSEYNEEYTSKAKESINGYYTIKGVGIARIFAERLNASASKLENANTRLNHTKAFNTLLSVVAINILRVAGQLFFVNNAMNGLLDVASVAVLMGYINNVGNPVSSILSMIEPINSTVEVREKVIDFLELNNGKKGTLKLQDEFNGIHFNKVTFSYDGTKNVLDNFTFDFKKGKKYALLGESGCGKSTVLKLIMGYYDNYDGNVYYNCQDIMDIDKRDYRKKISYITQKPYIFSESIENNITLGKNNYSQKEIDEVLEKVQLKELYDIVRHEDYNINDFSGGEKQRISLARALIAGTEVVLMDESTAALDNATSSVVEKNILEDPSKTVVSIVHRFNDSMRLYDTICYMENGVIVEAGTYDQLMQWKGKVYSMFTGKESVRYEKDV